jgi:hypothetical protein
MKKIYTIVLMMAVLAALIPTLVFADETVNENEELYEQANDNDELFQEATSSFSKDDLIGKQFKVRGKWGNAGDKEHDGYFGGLISIRSTENGHLYGVFKGRYNKTGEDSFTEFIGILKKGYFNGKIITDEGETKVTGLYKIDRENHLLKLQWMIPFHSGWAVGRISPIEE